MLKMLLLKRLAIAALMGVGIVSSSDAVLASSTSGEVVDAPPMSPYWNVVSRVGVAFLGYDSLGSPAMQVCPTMDQAVRGPWENCPRHIGGRIVSIVRVASIVYNNQTWTAAKVRSKNKRWSGWVVANALIPLAPKGLVLELAFGPDSTGNPYLYRIRTNEHSWRDLEEGVHVRVIGPEDSDLAYVKVIDGSHAGEFGWTNPSWGVAANGHQKFAWRF